MKKDKIESLFEKITPALDREEPMEGHEARFLAKLETGQKGVSRGVSWWKPLAVAASVLFIIGLFLGPAVWRGSEADQIASISPEISNTELYFAAVIEQQVKLLEDENTPETKKVVSDALSQLDLLEADYAKLKTDLLRGGDHKIILSAIIQNFQTRIDLLQDVLQKIEMTKNLKDQYNENNSI
jgi:hypothetical protein